jgi:hypothetical protein
MSSPSARSSSASAGTVWTVRDVRRAIALVAITFPWALLLGYQILEGWPEGWPFPDSVSTYFHSASMHYIYMVGLIGLGLLLIFYQYRDSRVTDIKSGLYVFGTGDFVFSTLAGLSAIGVAVFPPAPECVPGPNNTSIPRIPHGIDITCPPTDLQNRVNFFHHIFTVSLFFCIVVMLVFFFTKTNTNIPRFAAWKSLTGQPKKFWRNRVYLVCALLMVIGGMLPQAWALLHQVWSAFPSAPDTALFFGESGALTAFGVAWIAKGELFLVDDNAKSSSNSSRDGLLVVVTILVLGGLLLTGILISSLALMS